MKKFGLHSTQVLINDQLIEATVVIQGEIISEIIPGPIKDQYIDIEDLNDLVIMPGLIDSHVHINEPGNTEWEGFDTATKSAAAGGITSLVDMPLNSLPVTIDKKSFEKKLAAAKGQCHVNCGFWGGLVPENNDKLDGLLEAGVLGIKIFLTHSGIDEFPNVVRADIIKAIEHLKKYDAPLLIHCELETTQADKKLLRMQPWKYQGYLASRPRDWEDAAIKMMIEICEEYAIPVHIVHLSSSNSIAQIREAKQKGVPLTVETCPHYLFFNSENIPDGATEYKCAPPIREAANNALLWQAVMDGTIDFVVTDHSPAPPEMKALDMGDFSKAWGGIASLQLSLPAMWTLADQNGMSIPQLAKLMSKNVARFLNWQDNKGKIEAGYDADLAIWNPTASFKVEAIDLFHKHKVTPYIGHELKGVVQQTYVMGNRIFNNGKIEQLNKGKIILKREDV